MRLKGFVGGAYTLRSVNAECQQCVNLYPEIDESQNGRDGEAGYLAYTPGLTTWGGISLGVCRCLYTDSSGIGYVVHGEGFFRINSTGSIQRFGTLNTTTGQVSMADNGTEMVIVDGPYGYVFNNTTETFSARTGTGFTGGGRVVYIDGYFITNEPDTKRFWISSLNGTDVDALDFGEASATPENIETIVASHRELWVFKKSHTEQYYNDGNADFPFALMPSGILDYGCVASKTPARINDNVAWIGGNKLGQGVVYMARGNQASRISTFAIEQAMLDYGTISDATSYTYHQDGHSFYILNFHTGNATWAYDLNTGLWHQRAWTNVAEGSLDRHRAEYHAYMYGKNVVADWENDLLYYMEFTTFTDNGVDITRMRTTPHVNSELKRLFYSKFELDFQAGVGTNQGMALGVDPQVMLQWSDDWGHTWSNEHWLPMGQVGEYRRRAVWRRLGQARDRVFRVMVTDPVPVYLFGAELEVQKGVS